MKRYRWLAILLLVVFILASGALLRSLAQTKEVVAAKPDDKKPAIVELTKDEYHAFNSSIASRDEADKEIAALEDRLFQEMIKRTVARQQIDQFVGKLPAGAVLQKDAKGFYAGYVIEKKPEK